MNKEQPDILYGRLGSSILKFGEPDITSTVLYISLCRPSPPAIMIQDLLTEIENKYCTELIRRQREKLTKVLQ